MKAASGTLRAGEGSGFAVVDGACIILRLDGTSRG